MGAVSRAPAPGIEWPTLGLIFVVYAGWFGLTLAAGIIGEWPAAVLLAVLLTLHSSLQHEIMHGHPFRRQWLNDLFAMPGVGIFIPYGRFRALHLAHHKDANLTDPLDDPESFYFEPEVFHSLPRWAQRVLEVNNTLLGRIVIGPLVGTEAFMRTEMRLIRRGDRTVQRDWVVHLLTVVAVIFYLDAVGMPLLPYVAACYGALAILKIRTFAEHQAHLRAPSRSVIIEDRGPLAFLFLNNNLHAVHHSHPQVPWYALPVVFRSKRIFYLARNGGYRFDGYGDLILQYLLRAKEPLPHPLKQKT
ncbi:fatty acid desaturase [Algicella marina]|uniref:Fatty acid desaturase n=1 Tax=Algicella marina TaxID=2683284 RepID=A0A6P1T915_9RHOB|nr:fatty acid desaturase [Algicella marina]QHQ37122.1 fatty acid desaturase [Algicella marina]